MYSVVYMGRINLYIPSQKLKIIDDYCKDKNKKRSNLMVGATMAFINNKGGVQCDYCGKSSMGKFKIVAYSWDDGESEKVKNLCESHLGVARKEGEVYEQ